MDGLRRQWFSRALVRVLLAGGLALAGLEGLPVAPALGEEAANPPAVGEGEGTGETPLPQAPSADVSATGGPATAPAPAVSQTVKPAITCTAKVKGARVRASGCKKVTVGTPASGKVLKSLSVRIEGYGAGSLSYRVGFVGSTKVKRGANGAVVRKGGAALRCLRLSLKGRVSRSHTVYYRVYVKGRGWLGWAKNGQRAGLSQAHWRGVQAVQVKLVKKGAKAPGSTKGRYVKAASKSQLLKALGKGSTAKKLQVIGTTYSFASKAGRQLKAAIREVESHAVGGKLSFVMLDLTTGEGVSYASKRVIYSASCLKGPYVAALNKYLPSSKASSGLMTETIVHSNNDTYATLRSRYGSQPMARLMASVGVSSWSASSKYTYVPCNDPAKLWVGCYWYFHKQTNANSAWCRGLYTHGTQSFIYQAFKGTYTVYAKPGWYPGNGLDVQNDSGIVMAGGKPYLITVMSGANGQLGRLATLCRALNAVVHRDMA